MVRILMGVIAASAVGAAIVAILFLIMSMLPGGVMLALGIVLSVAVLMLVFERDDIEAGPRFLRENNSPWFREDL